MFTKFAATVALSALALVSAQANSNSTFKIDPQQVDISDAVAWCTGEQDSCNTLCGTVIDNDCSTDTLDFTCVCQGGNQPDMNLYKNTMPWFVCTKLQDNCIVQTENNAAGQKNCTETFGDKCGTENVADHAGEGASSSSATPSGTAAAESSSTNTAVPTSSSEAAAMPTGVQYLGNGAAAVAYHCIASTEMAFSLPIGTRRSSIGIELEFLVAHLRTGQSDPDENQADHLPPLLRIDEAGEWRAEAVMAHIRDTLVAYGIPVNMPNPEEPEDDSTPERIRRIGKWDVTLDVTVKPDIVSDYHFTGVEVRSPAMWARQESWREIWYVVNLLKSQYRLEVNASCGFHVHVGNGRDFFTADAIKRVGAFLFAADPMLSRLHAPWRRVHTYSLSIRYESKLACRRFNATKAHELVETEKERAEERPAGIELDEIPVTTWSDTSREEVSHGGRDEWTRYAKRLIDRGQRITYTEDIDAGTDEEKARENIAKKIKGLISRMDETNTNRPPEAFYQYLGQLLEHPNPRREITVDGTKIMRNFENLAALLELGGDHAQEGVEYVSRLEYRQALRSNGKLEELLESLRDYAASQNSRRGDSVGNGTPSDGSVEGGSSGAGGSPPGSPARASKASIARTSASGFRPPAREDQDDKDSDEGTRKLRPHNVEELSPDYVKAISTFFDLRDASWDRIAWLPSATHPRPDPTHVPTDPKALCDFSCPDHPTTTTREGVAEIMACSSAAAAGALLQHWGFSRLNYNFNAYTPDGLDPDIVEKNRGTIEFREAGGSLDAAWIVCWARICAGIVQWARYARVDEFFELLERIEAQEDRDQRFFAAAKGFAERDVEEEEDEERRYDVCDLLFDIGLFVEAMECWELERRHGPPR
ncbi:putative amidoligase enzyme-domain-containing protein [Xylariaceae sp. FL0662B]|nr:putative amidoligase enzyme-domain-containing protein [Xylariaceae sp. FL0662B]